MMSDTVAGADAGGSTLLEQVEAAQTAAEAAEATSPTAGAQQPVVAPDSDSAPEGQGNAEADPSPAPPDANAATRDPLTVEEYRTRHENLNKALREERQARRAERDQMAALQARLDHFEKSQPQSFAKFNLEQRLADYAAVDYQAWAAQDADAANRAWSEYQALQGEKSRLDEQERQDSERRQQEGQQQQLRALVSTINDQEAQFRQFKPDYDQAVGFIKDQLAKEANTQGYFGQQEALYVQRQILDVSARVHSSGKDIAEFTYDLAVQNGYAPPAPPAPDIAPIKAGADAAKTISSLSPTGVADSTSSLEANVARLDGSALRDYWKKAKAARY